MPCMTVVIDHRGGGYLQIQMRFTFLAVHGGQPKPRRLISSIRSCLRHGQQKATKSTIPGRPKKLSLLSPIEN